MKSHRSSQTLTMFFLLCLAFGSISALAQQPNLPDEGIPASALTTKTVQAVGYVVGGGGTKVDLVGTELMSGASGEAKVEVKTKAGANIEVEVRNLQPPSTLGAELLTYVLWVVTPEGRSGNMGEIFLDKTGYGKVKVTAPVQTFSMIVTAEPYFAVRTPSEMVVLQSQPRKNTKGKIFPVSAYKLMKRSQYEKLGNPLALTLDPKTPLEIYEARSAVEVAKSRAAEKYAPEVFSKAEASLQMMERGLSSKAQMNTVLSSARQTVQFAEDARALSVQRQDQERIAAEKAAAAAKAKAEAEAKAAAEAAEAKRIADAKAAEAKRKADAELAATQKKAAEELAEQQRKAAAEVAAQEAARKAEEQKRLEAEREKAALRAKLLEQFNRVLPTTDTARGLVVNMGDVLFDVSKSNLRSDAQIALAKLSGIVLNYPQLKLSIEGYTDSTGSEDFNQKLSEARAGAVRDYLVSQGLDASSLTAQGFGESNPVADNKTAKGRQQNRRVEIVVSGEVIGTQIGKS